MPDWRRRLLRCQTGGAGGIQRTYNSLQPYYRRLPLPQTTRVLGSASRDAGYVTLMLPYHHLVCPFSPFDWATSPICC